MPLPPRNPDKPLRRLDAPPPGVGPAPDEQTAEWRDAMKHAMPLRHRPKCPPREGVAVRKPQPAKVVEAIDLHGMSEKDAHEALVMALEAAQAQHQRQVVVITGLGRHRPGGGILRREVPRWLESIPAAATWHVHGGEVRVRLKRGKP